LRQSNEIAQRTCTSADCPRVRKYSVQRILQFAQPLQLLTPGLGRFPASFAVVITLQQPRRERRKLRSGLFARQRQQQRLVQRVNGAQRGGQSVVGRVELSNGAREARKA
jgi:hypothetical protein